VAVGAPIRPDSWDFPLLVHVLGAMLLVGALVLAASALILAWRDGSASLVRLGYRSLLIGALPAWIVMRGTAEWIADKEGLTGDEVPSWVDIGYSTADAGFLLLLISTLLAGLAVRRARRVEPPGGGFRRVSTVVVSLALVAYLVAIWAMTTKPV
jgi:phosphoglycerol transferase MdoB-like AlkP superfamily enzyme